MTLAPMLHAPMLLKAATHDLPALVAAVAAAADPWKDFYGDSKVAATAVVFAHLGALFVGGGLALAADRATLRAVRGGAPVAREAGARSLADLAGTHRPVVIALAVVFISGVMLFLSDVETFWTSPVYWIKMTLVAALLVNGWLMTRTEATLASTPEGGAAPWGRLRTHAWLSAALWMATLLAGVALAFIAPLTRRAKGHSYAVPAADGVEIDRENDVILVRWQSAVYAFNLSCPHQNTALRWDEGDLRFQCPKHHSKYAPDGRYLEGRATRSMDRLAISHDGDSVLVDVDTMYREDRDAAAYAAAVVHLA